MNHSEEDDGIFFIGFSDYLKYFSDFQICEFHDNFCYSALKMNSKFDDKTFLSFKVRKRGKFYLSINQMNKRFFPPSDNYDYSPVSLLVFHKDG